MWQLLEPCSCITAILAFFWTGLMLCLLHSKTNFYLYMSLNFVQLHVGLKLRYFDTKFIEIVCFVLAEVCHPFSKNSEHPWNQALVIIHLRLVVYYFRVFNWLNNLCWFSWKNGFLFICVEFLSLQLSKFGNHLCYRQLEIMRLC